MVAALTPSLAIVVFLFGFLAVSLGLCWFLARASGWYGLSKVYPDTKPGEIRETVWQSISMGGVSYRRGCVNVGLTETGVHLKTFYSSRFMNAPLLIPWSEITSITTKTWLFYTRYQLSLTQTGTTICFYGTLGEAIWNEWQKRSNKSLSVDLHRQDDLIYE
jgi:hypothetical protein